MITKRRDLFLERSVERDVAWHFTGPVFIWDVDKTYLDTAFDKAKGLLWIPFEFAVDKMPVKGAVELLRAMRHGPEEESALNPIFFISGSPPQLRRVIEQRMTLDGVQFDGLTLKDQLGLLLRCGLRGLRHQVGYKLAALLMTRLELPRACSVFLLGDDVESDPLVYTLFNEICAGSGGDAMRARLTALGVWPSMLVALMPLVDAVAEVTYPMAEIFIRCVKKTPLPNDPRLHGFRDFSEVRTWMIHAKLIRATRYHSLDTRLSAV